jgi:hypothetical protein
MTEFMTDCNGCHAFTLMEIMTIADSLAEESYPGAGNLINKEDLVKVRKLHYIATVAENAVSKLRVEGRLCRQCPWYDK